MSLLPVLGIGDNECFSFLWCTGLAIRIMFHIQFELVRTLRRNESEGTFQRYVVGGEPVGYFTKVAKNLKLGEEIQQAVRAGLEPGA